MVGRWMGGWPRDGKGIPTSSLAFKAHFRLISMRLKAGIKKERKWSAGIVMIEIGRKTAGMKDV
jgi:hypothetical protein